MVVGGQQDELVPTPAGVLVHGGQRDVAVIVKHDLGDAVLLFLNAVGGLVEQVEGEFEFVVHSKPESLTCPDNLKGFVGATLRCQLTDSGKACGVTVTVTSVDAGDVNFDFKVDDQPT